MGQVNGGALVKCNLRETAERRWVAQLCCYRELGQRRHIELVVAHGER